MIQLKDIGNFETLPQIVIDIIYGNIKALDESLRKKWNIEKKIMISKHSSYTPLDYAIIMSSFPSIKWLVEHRVNLNSKYNHSFLRAVRYCDEEIIRYLVEHGAEINGDDFNATDAFEEALYGKKIKNLSLIHELGHTVRKYGNNAFLNSIAFIDHIPNYDVLDFFISNDVDINCREYHSRSTPLCIAAQYSDLKMVKYLVKHGADAKLAGKYGMRPYTIALERGDLEMAAYFKSLEPVEFHSLQHKLNEIKKYKLTKPLLDFLQSNNLRLNFRGECEYIDFFAIIDTIPMKAGRKKVLRLSREVDSYPDVYIVWNPKTQNIAYYDYEHESFSDIASFDDFISNVGLYMRKVISGEI